MAEEEELNDDSRKICDIKPTGGVLIISECRGNSVDHSINIAIGHLIGKGKKHFNIYLYQILLACYQLNFNC